MSTYIQMVNKLIRKVNEVEVTEAQFPDAIGVTAVAKDSIIDSLDKIYNKKHKWPFMAQVHQETLTMNAQIYAFPEDMLSVDWNSFRVLPYTGIYKGEWITPIQTQEYYRYLSIDDNNWITNNPTLGKGSPKYVTEMNFKNPFIENSKGQAYLISPPPSRIESGASTFDDYRIVYQYYRKPIRPVLANDPIDIPEEWEYVLFSRALYHMYLFYDNNDRSTIADADFQEGYKDMINTLLSNNSHHVYSGQVDNGSDPLNYTGYGYRR